MTEQPKGQAAGQKVQIKIKDEIMQGFYTNLMQVVHGKEEFVIDFMNVVAGQGTVGARVIASPGHLKRMIAALNENLKKYEEQFGKIEEGKSQAKSDFGFQTQS